MIVVDTNVIAYFWLPGDFTRQAEAALTKDPDWAVPYLWRSEFRNVLATYVRAKRLAAIDAHSIYLNAESMLAGREYAVVGMRALALAFESRLLAYDCEYVALADELGCKFVSSDRKLLKAYPKLGVPLATFT